MCSPRGPQRKSYEGAADMIEPAATGSRAATAIDPALHVAAGELVEARATEIRTEISGGLPRLPFA
jgi:hypothetical protein